MAKLVQRSYYRITAIQPLVVFLSQREKYRCSVHEKKEDG